MIQALALAMILTGVVLVLLVNLGALSLMRDRVLQNAWPRRTPRLAVVGAALLLLGLSLLIAGSLIHTG